jgi:hypothetical protein
MHVALARHVLNATATYRWVGRYGYLRIYYYMMPYTQDLFSVADFVLVSGCEELLL